MSGWIKWEKPLDNDPRVLRMARRTEKRLCNAYVTQDRYKGNALPFSPVTLVCGALVKMWSYADTHIGSDDVLEVGPNELDHIVGLPGFSEVCPSDWLEIIDEETVKLPNYQEHNGVEAKRRAATQKRVKRHRNAAALQERNAPVTLEPLPDQDQDQDHTKKDIGHLTKPNDPERFDEFWSIYPKKVKKKPTWTKWKSKGLDRIADQIIEDVKARTERDRRWREGFIPDPLTYINQERWEDEIDDRADGRPGSPKSAVERNREGSERFLRQRGYVE